MIFEYKNYQANCEYDESENLYYGEVLLLKDVVTFEGNTPQDAEKEFRESVDVYLEWCEQEKCIPNKPMSQVTQKSRVAS